MKHTHQPYYVTDIFLSDGLITSKHFNKIMNTMMKKTINNNINDNLTMHVAVKCNTFAALSAPYSPIHFIGTERIIFTEGMHEVMNYKKNELISFSDSTGAIMMITTDVPVMEPNTIEEVGRVFQKEVIWRKELDAWNSKYIEEFRSMRENDVDSQDYSGIKLHAPNSVHSDSTQPTWSQEQIKRKIWDEIFK